MNIFNNKTVIGLFGRDRDVEQVVTHLQEEGFGGENEAEIQIIDEHRLAQETPIDAPARKTIAQPQGGGAAGFPARVHDLVNEAGSDTAAIEQEVRDSLIGLGLDQEEATFYAQRTARGSALVIVETSEARAPKALEIMQEAEARISVT